MRETWKKEPAVLAQPQHRKWLVLLLAMVGVVALTGVASGREVRPPVGKEVTMADSGFVIRSDAVIRNCGACHTVDESGRMGRLSYLRKTPEGWQRSIRRMVSLHGVQLEPSAAREIVKYLSDEQGLAPEELRPGLFEVERRMDPFRYSDAATQRTCSACHSMGRVITQRRTMEEWSLLISTHRSLYPLIDRQAFYTGSNESDDGSDSSQQPVELAIENLADAFPLHTPEWDAWSANVRAARIEGVWALAGHDPGKGPIFGIVEVRAVPSAPDEFTTNIAYRYARDGTLVSAAGSGLVYTGYQWRGRSQHSSEIGALREVLSVERGWDEIRGRWFRGASAELGIDVAMRRTAAAPMISGIHPAAIRTGSGPQEVRVYGVNLPEGLTASGVDFGPDVEVREVISSNDELAVLRVEAMPGAQAGKRDVFVEGAFLSDALVVYRSVGGIRVVPDLGLARVGGTVAPKQFQQFEAIGIDHGQDGQGGTEDDVEIGVIDVDWSLDEYPVTYDDDDIRFVGEIDADGLFTPAVDGPNPQRTGNRNNIGEVWVVASLREPEVADTAPEGRAYLIVTAPVHLRWGAWEDQ